MAQARKQFRMMDSPPARQRVEQVIHECRTGDVTCEVIEIKDHTATVEITGPAAQVERVYSYGAMARYW
jgi:hypothetical protein